MNRYITEQEARAIFKDEMRKMVGTVAEPLISSLTTEERINLEQKLQVKTISTEINLSNLQDEPFVGMWKDREDMKDSSQWVRQVRQQEWTS